MEGWVEGGGEGAWKRGSVEARERVGVSNSFSPSNLPFFLPSSLPKCQVIFRKIWNMPIIGGNVKERARPDLSIGMPHIKVCND